MGGRQMTLDPLILSKTGVALVIDGDCRSGKPARPPLKTEE
jgi:hypothetical protein